MLRNIKIQLFYKELFTRYYLTLLHYVNYVYKELNKFYAILFHISSLMMIPCGRNMYEYSL
jgi:hypothetical protein